MNLAFLYGKAILFLKAFISQISQEKSRNGNEDWFVIQRHGLI
jgi:hypothetical protein